MDQQQEQNTLQSPLQPSAPPQQNIQSSGFYLSIKHLVIFCCVFLILAGCGVYILMTRQSLQKSLGNTHAQQTGSSAVALPTYTVVSQAVQKVSSMPTPDLTKDWQTFSSPQKYFSIKYPTKTYVDEFKTPYYYVAVYPDPNTVAAGVHANPIFVVSVLPDTFTTTNISAYDFTSNDWIARLSKLNTGDTIPTGSVLFAKNADETAGGQTALVVSVTAKGFKQKRVYIKKNGFWYSIADYYQTDPDPNQFALFLSSFKFTQ